MSFFDAGGVSLSSSSESRRRCLRDPGAERRQHEKNKQTNKNKEHKVSKNQCMTTTSSRNSKITARRFEQEQQQKERLENKKKTGESTNLETMLQQQRELVEISDVSTVKTARRRRRENIAAASSRNEQGHRRQVWRQTKRQALWSEPEVCLVRSSLLLRIFKASPARMP